MFLWKQIGPEFGIEPNRNYRAHLHVQLASNAPTGCAGVGGSPGEGVTLKGGITGREPVVTQTGSFVGLNLDKGNQATDEQELHLMGDIANGRPCKSAREYVLLSPVLYQPVTVRSAEPWFCGSMWALIRDLSEPH